MFDGPGGAVAVLNGPDGKFVVDTFVAPAWPRLKEALEALGNAPVQYVIDTHWHFDHTDNNAHLHAAGAVQVLAFTKTLMASACKPSRMIFRSCIEDQTARVSPGLHFDPSIPAEALPQQTFHRTVTSYKPMAKPSRCNVRCSRAHGFGHLRSFSKCTT